VLTLEAPAKINLTLEVLALRPDGFHEIKSVMQTIGLGDQLTLEPGTGIKYICDNPAWLPEKSLLANVVNLLRESTGTTRDVTLRVSKRIPLVSGLGGESSLAAAALRGLNRFWELNLAAPQLEELAARIGSDVAFFLRGGTALAQGRGERITSLPPAPRMWVVLLMLPPKVPEKTTRLYQHLEESHRTRGLITKRMVTRLSQGAPPLSSMLFNVFDAVAHDIFPGLEAYRHRFFEAGAPAVHLAGAGPTLITLVEDQNRAEAVRQKLTEQGHHACLVAITPAISDKDQNIL